MLTDTEHRVAIHDRAVLETALAVVVGALYDAVAEIARLSK